MKVLEISCIYNITLQMFAKTNYELLRVTITIVKNYSDEQIDSEFDNELLNGVQQVPPIE